MSSQIKKQLKEVDQLVTKGKSNEALKFIERILTKDLNEKEKALINSHKIAMYNSFGKYEEALNLVEEILNYFKKHKISILKIDVLLQKGIALAHLKEKNEEIKILIKEIEQNLTELADISSNNKYKIKASIFRLKLYITSARVEPKKYFKYAQNCNKFAKKSKDSKLINFSLLVLAHAYYRLNEKDKCLDLINEAYQHAISLDYKQGQEDSLWGLSYYETNREKSLDYAEEAIALHEKIESKRSSYGRYVYLGCIYVHNCDFEKALISLNKAEKLLKEEDKEKYDIYFVYARLFNLKGEFNLAYENILRAQKIAKESNRTMFAKSHYDLLLLALELEKFDLAEKHQEELRDFSKELDDDEINQLSLLASALILKTNKGIREWNKAIVILEELLENEALSTLIFINATLNLCELLIREIELTGDVGILDSIQTHLTKLQNIAENQKIHWLLIEILRLKSQIALLVFDIIKARELLEAALRVSQKKRIEKLTIEIINEQIEIEEKITIWKKLQELDAPLIETLKHVHLLNNIVEINQKTATVKTCSGEKNTIEYRKLFSLKI